MISFAYWRWRFLREEEGFHKEVKAEISQLYLSFEDTIYIVLYRYVVQGSNGSEPPFKETAELLLSRFSRVRLCVTP